MTRFAGGMGSTGPGALWIKVKGGKRPIKIHRNGHEDVDSLLKRVKAEVRMKLADVDLDDLQLFPRETVKEPMAANMDVSEISGGNFEEPLYLNFDAPSTNAEKKFFRVRRLQHDDVHFLPGGVLPETVIPLVSKNEADFNRKMDKESIKRLTKFGTLEDLTYDDIETEPLDVWRSSCDGVKYDAHFDFGTLSSQYASRGVKGYHDALESECGEWLRSERGCAVADEGLYHKDHKFQVFMKSPLDSAERERDGLVLWQTQIGLVSVKSRFGEKEFEQLVADISLGKGLQTNEVPRIDLSRWEVKREDGGMMTLLELHKKYFEVSRNRLKLFCIAATPVFTPGKWQERMFEMKAVRPLQRVGRHEWRPFRKMG